MGLRRREPDLDPVQDRIAGQWVEARRVGQEIEVHTRVRRGHSLPGSRAIVAEAVGQTDYALHHRIGQLRGRDDFSDAALNFHELPVADRQT